MTKLTGGITSHTQLEDTVKGVVSEKGDMLERSMQLPQNESSTFIVL